MRRRRAAGVSQAAAICCAAVRASGKIRVSWLSDVVNRIKTEGRKPVARSSSGSGDPSSCSFPEAPGGFSAEPWSRPLSCPPRRLLYGRVSVFPSYGRLPAHLALTRVFSGAPQALGDCGGCGRAGLLFGFGGYPVGLSGDCMGGSLLLPGLLPPAKSEAESLQFGFLCRKPESGLCRKVDSSPGWFCF